MTNVSNMVISTGRLADDVKVFDNSNGSKKVRMTVCAQDNYKGKDGKRGTQFIPYEAYIAPGKEMGVYGLMHKGDLVTVTGTVKNNNYTDKDGVKNYGIILQVESVVLLEGKKITDQRHDSHVAAEAAEAVEGAEEEIAE